MPRKLKFSIKRQEWSKNRTATLNGLPLRQPITEQERYANKVGRLTKRMADEFSRELKRLFRSDEAREYFGTDNSISGDANRILNRLTRKYTQAFNEVARPWSVSMINQANKSSQIDMFSSLKQLSGGLSIKTSDISEDMKDIMRASISGNVDYIKSIPQDYIYDVKSAVMRSITQEEGGGLKSLQETIDFMLSEKYQKHHNKARNVALDQTRKAYNHLNKGRMKAAGLTCFKWIHSGGGQRPREYHRDELNGEIFSFDNLPLLERDNIKMGRGIPGDAINCRCTMLPIVRLDDGTILD